jgi:8-hydroxy-5-deazaflavin:NADPH oxidoreductase
MKIAIIGAGNVGRALGSSFATAGHDVTFAARDAAKTAAAATAVGGSFAATPAAAAVGADVIVFAVPFTEAEALAGTLVPVAAGTVVIDATNPLKADYSGLATEGGPSGAERIAAALGGVPVVKAFNTLFAGVQGNPAAHGQVLDALYATDDDAAGAVVAGLASDIGFRAVKVGPLSAARELEAMAWLNIRLQLINGGAWQTSYVLVAAPEAAVA